AAPPLPSEILDRCRLLKQQWAAAQHPVAPETGFKEERVRHPQSPHLRATLHLRQLSSIGVAQPHFLIECEDLRRQAAPRGGPASSRLPHLVRLTRCEQEDARPGLRPAFSFYQTREALVAHADEVQSFGGRGETSRADFAGV